MHMGFGDFDTGANVLAIHAGEIQLLRIPPLL